MLCPVVRSAVFVTGGGGNEIKLMDSSECNCPVYKMVHKILQVMDD